MFVPDGETVNETVEIVDDVEEVTESEVIESEESEESPDEIIVSIGDEPPPEEVKSAPGWVRELRKSNREKDKRIRELESQMHTPEKKQSELGPKPTLNDFDYDVDKYESSILEWHERKRQIDAAANQAKIDSENQQKEWDARLQDYSKAKSELKVSDYEDAEESARQIFSVTQQGVVLQGADNPALVIYALGKSPKKAKELAEIKDPVKFAFAVAKLEKDLKVTNRKAAPPPEKVVHGSGKISGSVDSKLEQLRDEASRTGNMTKVIQYKLQKRSSN